MLNFAFLGIAAFLFVLISTPLLRGLFIRRGLVDHPDGGRKLHARAVPRVGGIAIVFSYVCALLLLFVFNPGGSRIYVQHGHLLYALLPTAGLIFFVGLLDDLKGLRPTQKLAGQLLASMFAVGMGARLTIPYAPLWVSMVVSVGWLIGCTNAVNLIDGMDGLATGVSLVATLTALCVALLTGNHGLALATIPLAGCLFGFLVYNFNPASVFLGDCGSLTVGFALGCFSLIWSNRTGTWLGMIAPLMALAIPLLDVCLAIGRRFLRSAPITQADRGHIHHMVLKLGFSTRAATLILYAACALCSSLAVLESFATRDDVGWAIFLTFCILLVAGIDRLSYTEFRAAGKSLHHSTIRRAVQDEIYIEGLDRALLNADSPESWWTIVDKLSADLSFASAHLEIDGQAFGKRFIISSEPPSCRIHLEMGRRGILILTRLSEASVPSGMMAVLNCFQKAALRETNTAQPVVAAGVSRSIDLQEQHRRAG